MHGHAVPSGQGSDDVPDAVVGPLLELQVFHDRAMASSKAVACQPKSIIYSDFEPVASVPHRCPVRVWPRMHLIVIEANLTAAPQVGGWTEPGSALQRNSVKEGSCVLLYRTPRVSRPGELGEGVRSTTEPYVSLLSLSYLTSPNGRPGPGVLYTVALSFISSVVVSQDLAVR